MVEVALIVSSHVPLVPLLPAAYAILAAECTHPRCTRCDSFAAGKTVLEIRRTHTTRNHAEKLPWFRLYENENHTTQGS